MPSLEDKIRQRFVDELNRYKNKNEEVPDYETDLYANWVTEKVNSLSPSELLSEISMALEDNDG